MFSSAPSSAYYSDLSTTTNVPSGERTYDMVGLVAINQNCCPLLEADSDVGGQGDQTHFDLTVLSSSSSHPNTLVGRHHHRLSAITEGSGSNQLQPSDFV